MMEQRAYKRRNTEGVKGSVARINDGYSVVQCQLFWPATI